MSTPPRGLAVPSVRIPGGTFAVRSAVDSAFGDVLMAVLTPMGSRPFARGFGSRLHTLLFGRRSVTQDGTADYIVRDAVQRQCPTVNIAGVGLGQTVEGIQVEVTFSLASDPVAQTRSTFLRQSDLLQTVYSPR